MRIGLYGGSFNPVHKGHLHCAEQAHAQLGLDQTLFIPCYKSPFKDAYTVHEQHRLAMLGLAMAKHQNWGISTYEVEQEKTSRTVDTVRHFQKTYPNAQLYFIMGTDCWVNLHQWYQWQTLVNEVNLVVIGRDYAQKPPKIQTEYFQTLPSGCLQAHQSDKTVTFINADNVLVSSTQIRQATINSQLEQYVPNAVAAYIVQHKLYQNED